jgi:uncharacterized SAM-binding protein YcdF (DUF218 family)
VKRWSAALIVLFSVWLFTAPVSSRALLKALDNSFPRIPIDRCPPADAIAVLSGDGPPRPRPLLPTESPSRSEAGLALYHAGRAHFLIFTDGGREARESRAAALRAGVPAARILIVAKALDTADEARLIVQAAQETGWHRLILVTSGYHMGRAQLLLAQAAAARHVPLTVLPFPADSGKHFLTYSGIGDYLPSLRGFEHSARAIREIAGQWTGRMTGPKY